jgi:hypothetical protein
LVAATINQNFIDDGIGVLDSKEGWNNCAREDIEDEKGFTGTAGFLANEAVLLRARIVCRLRWI